MSLQNQPYFVPGEQPGQGFAVGDLPVGRVFRAAAAAFRVSGNDRDVDAGNNRFPDGLGRQIGLEPFDIAPTIDSEMLKVWSPYENFSKVRLSLSEGQVIAVIIEP